MLTDGEAFSSFSTSDLAAAKVFYGEVLKLKVEETPEGLAIHLAGGGNVFLYPKPDHTPATFTVLNFRVGDLEETVAALKQHGVQFETYDMPGLKTGPDGIYRGEGPKIAWFKDPSGNILSVLEER